MASVPEIILDNPFRVLGVYANSSYREIVASISKATKFMEVGRDVDYPLDLPKVKNLNVKSNLTHSLADLDNALALISNSEERLKYAQFWFLRMTPLDDEAFGYLFAGDNDVALLVWHTEENLSSLQNRIIISLWKGDYKSALHNAEHLYTFFPNEFLKAVDSKGTLVKSSADLVQSFVDTLVAYLSTKELLDSIPSSFLGDFIVPTISEDAITKINKALQDAQDRLDMLNSEGRKAESSLPNLGIGGKLLYDIKDELDLLKKVSTPDNPRLQLTSDRLANMLYECSIDEYNIRKFSPKYSINMLMTACTLANNSVDKEEINKKIDLFQKKADKNKEENKSNGGLLGCGSYIMIIFFFMIMFILYLIFMPYIIRR
ncbi:MAG: hypothetical protein J6Z01_10485 [Bacteroidales bacterium]|nr:hypothetical protein [Bacteroidales bacterium]